MIKKLDSIFARDIIEIHEKSLFPIWKNLGKKFNKISVERFVRRLFCKGEIYGYFIGEKIVAALGIDEKDNETLEISFLIVLPEFQKKGIGKKLMEFSEKMAREKGYETLSLDVLTNNDMAVSFYKKLDYKVIKEYVKDDYKKYLMEKNLG